MNIELDPSLLRAFVAAVDMMSFSKAASLVHKSPATVSMQIAKLEERLDTVFFIRDTRNLRLTQSGEELLGYAQRMLRLQDEAIEAIRRPDLEGSVTIGAPDDYIGNFFTAGSQTVRRAFPKGRAECHLYADTRIDADDPVRRDRPCGDHAHGGLRW